jgi:transcriptional regulator of acetoin/glycerol metabolism
VRLAAQDFGSPLAAGGEPRAIAPEAEPPPEVTLDDVMKAAVSKSLVAAHGDCAKAARFLGISRPSIYRKMARYGLRRSGISEGIDIGLNVAPRTN